MKRLLLFALLLSAAACSEDNAPTPQISLSTTEALLRSDAGSTASIIVTADDAWTLTTINSSDFTITPQSGSRGQTTVTLTATQQNTQKTRQTLGEVHFTLTYGAMSCSLSVVQSPALAPQTVLLYMPGTSLSGYFKNNIKAIEAAVTAHIPGDGRILVCYQPKSNNKAELLEIAFDGDTQKSRTTTIKEYDQFAANEIASVQRLLADMALAAPAQRYGLIIGCHGKAWIPASAGVLYRRNLTHDDNCLGTPYPNALPTRSFGDSSYQLDITDLATAIGHQTYKLDYLIFDACFMANIETLYDLRNVVGAVIASPCEIMAAGFPYSRII
ncbi:MAG: clostripain-related cysteine peptidase, partial [Alistipes sp.]